jgi:hypothetical protein
MAKRHKLDTEKMNIVDFYNGYLGKLTKSVGGEKKNYMCINILLFLTN